MGFGRLGNISTIRGDIETPSLMPVVALIGGTTINSGGLWRYVRDHIFNMRLPVLSETTHFLNFNLSPKSLKNWREKSFSKWFEEFKSPLFLDSGGFQLLNNKDYDLSSYNLKISPEDILKLQLDFGGEMIATLDYPIPPNLNASETKKRINFTIDNAIKTLKILEERGDNQTRVYVPIHGRNKEEISFFINKFVREFGKSGVSRKFNGFAVGSLVPLRSNPERIVEILIAVKKNLQKKELQHLPVHVFGVGSTLIPYLVYLGIDTFDNSTYVQQSRNLKYANPETWSYHRATQLKEITCNCAICKDFDIKEMKDVLTSEISFKPINGRFKSEFYASIAIHNLNTHLAALNEAKEALAADVMEDHLIEFTRKRVKKGSTLEILASHFSAVRKKIGSRTIAVKKNSEDSGKTISLSYKSKDFMIPTDYKIPDKEDILFMFLCSKEKPYTTSQTFKKISAAVKSSLNGTSKRIHYVVISGLYGPVPIQFDTLPETTNYDFVLTFRNSNGIEKVGNKIAEYLATHGDKFKHIVAVAPSKPYRKAIEKGLIEREKAMVFPKKGKSGMVGKTTQFIQAIDQCVDFLKNIEDKQEFHNK